MTSPSSLPSEYYGFDRYIDRARWLTYYAQLHAVLSTAPKTVLEVGIGPGVVRSLLRDAGVHVTTVDVNASLGPDHVADLRSLPSAISDDKWDIVLCSRILHHIPLAEIPEVLDSLAALEARQVIVTVPREDLSLQLAFRRTAGQSHTARLSFGSLIKRQLRRREWITSAPSGLWMLDGESGVSKPDFDQMLRQRFGNFKSYILADDPSHVFYILGA